MRDTTKSALLPAVPGLAAVALVLFSIVSNLLLLTGPLFMLQVYDRVLGSRSLPTLVALTLLVAMLYGLYGGVEVVRARMSVRLGALLDAQLARDAFVANVRLRLKRERDAQDPVRSLDALRTFLAGPGPMALLDVPWVPVYMAIIYAFHPLLGVVASAGAIAIIGLLALNEFGSRKVAREATEAMRQRHSEADENAGNVEALVAMGMLERAAARWQAHQQRFNRAQMRASDLAGLFATASKGLRLFLQSAVLAAGAYLVVMGDTHAGLMIAASIMTSRALSPIDSLVGQWRSFISARQAAEKLGAALSEAAHMPRHLLLPAPQRDLVVDRLATGPDAKGPPTLRGVSFRLVAGEGMGILGASGSGKSSLARALVGVWPLRSGQVRLDGSEFNHYESGVLGPAIGYLPQSVELFDGSVAENIARLDGAASAEDVVAAAQAADVHTLITGLENGYDTRIGNGGARLSAGQRQRIGLARALYKNPFLLVLDEPNSNLDAEGETALTEAITRARQRGAIVIIIAHRPSAIVAVDRLLFLRNGEQAAFGPKREVLAAIAPKSVRALADREPRIANVS